MSDSPTTTEIPTLIVPAKLYDEALAFCNAVLKKKGKPLITELPPGLSHDAQSCPCGNAAGVWVYHNFFSEETPRYNDEDEFDIYKIREPKPPYNFICFFDTHAKGLTKPIRGDENAPLM